MKCTECGSYVPFKRTCPNCGGKMRAVESICDTRPWHADAAKLPNSGTWRSPRGD